MREESTTKSDCSNARSKERWRVQLASLFIVVSIRFWIANPLPSTTPTKDRNLIMWECSSYGSVEIVSYKWGSPSPTRRTWVQLLFHCLVAFPRSRKVVSQSVRPVRLAASPFRAQALNFIQTLHAHWQQKSRNLFKCCSHNSNTAMGWTSGEEQFMPQWFRIITTPRFINAYYIKVTCINLSVDVWTIVTEGWHFDMRPPVRGNQRIMWIIAMNSLSCIWLQTMYKMGSPCGVQALTIDQCTKSIRDPSRFDNLLAEIGPYACHRDGFGIDARHDPEVLVVHDDVRSLQVDEEFLQFTDCLATQSSFLRSVLPHL